MAGTLANTCNVIPPGRGSALVPSPDGRNDAVAENVLAVVTDPDREIMRLVSEGLSNKEIARRLNISHGTIKVNLHHVYQWLRCRGRPRSVNLCATPRPCLTAAARRMVSIISEAQYHG